MQRVWLANVGFHDVNIVERHVLTFRYGEHEHSQCDASEISVSLRTVVDAHTRVPGATLDLLKIASADSGVARVGVFGLALQRDDDRPDQTLEKLLPDLPTTPLFYSPDGDWVAWAIDLPSATLIAADEAGARDEEAVAVWSLKLPVVTDTYPVTVRAGLVFLDDDLIVRARNTAGPSGQQMQSEAVARTMERAAGERSLFGVQFLVTGGSLRGAARLAAFEIDATGDSDGSDFELHGANGTVRHGAYQVWNRRICFSGLEHYKVEGDGLRFTLLINNHDMLVRMGTLGGSMTIEGEGLATGFSHVLADGTGSLILQTGSTSTDCQVSARTVVTARFTTNLKDLFRRRPVSIHVRLQFPNRGLSRDRIASVEQVFRNVGFDRLVSERLDESGSHLIQARRIVEGIDRHLVILLRTVSREIQLETGSSLERVTSRRAGGDTTVDIAVLGPDHRKLAELLRDVQRRITDVFRGQ